MVQNTCEYDTTIQKNINYNRTTDPVCRVKNDTMRVCDLYSNRPVTVINGTLIINRVIRADSGNYTVSFSRSDGTVTSKDLQVNVEAPIGSVEVSISCSSSGVMRASCSSEGDQLLYSWTLNGDPLMDGGSSFDLNERTDGNITCSVKNHVSHGQKNVRLKPCPVLSFSLIALGCVALILILLFITLYLIYKKKQVKSTPATAGSVDVIYADISHKDKSERVKTESLPTADVEYIEIQMQKKRKEEEVQYGEVMFTLNHSSTHTRPQEECIYSQVHR
ncbi:hepatic and glial cell adhesion molecule-like [Carassius carassius]|uniref:hepatic and glial cell adhesion molecule-like n=1 Tax=Carassius carassius TaxID=217509 RepID=UPI002868A02C|nr:hepatic and glial cell adhesion molecule-like [Carassius carassius]